MSAPNNCDESAVEEKHNISSAGKINKKVNARRMGVNVVCANAKPSNES